MNSVIAPLPHCDEYKTLVIMEYIEEDNMNTAFYVFIEQAWRQDKIYARTDAERIINEYYEKYFK